YEGPGFVTNQTYPQDNRTERGPSDFDVKHFFTLSGIYDLPFLRGGDSFVAKAFGGWRISGILTKRTGFPFTPVVGRCTTTPRWRGAAPGCRWGQACVRCARRVIPGRATLTRPTTRLSMGRTSLAAERPFSSFSNRLTVPLRRRALAAIRFVGRIISMSISAW